MAPRGTPKIRGQGPTTRLETSQENAVRRVVLALDDGKPEPEPLPVWRRQRLEAPKARLAASDRRRLGVGRALKGLRPQLTKDGSHVATVCLPGKGGQDKGAVRPTLKRVTWKGGKG